MIDDIPAIVLIACYATSGAVLLHTIVHSACAPPKGTDPDFWRRAVRAYRHKRRKAR